MSATVSGERGSRAYLHVEGIMSVPGDTNERSSPAIDAVASDPGDRTTPVGSDDPRYAAVRADVEARLRRVCAGMPPESFAKLVRDICSRKVRWARDEDAPVS